MKKSTGLARMERLLWGALMVLYVPLMLLGPLMGMLGEAYIGATDPRVHALSGAAYWLSASLLLVIPAAAAGGLALRRRGCVRAAWVVLLVPLLVLAAVMGLDMAAGALHGM